MSDFTPEQVERAAEVLWLSQDGRRTGWPLVLSWDSRSEATRIIYREDALAVLSAAGAPEKVAPVRIDPSELAALIYSIEYGTDPDSAEPGDIEDRLGMADELIEWFAERHTSVVDEAALAEVIAPHKMIWAAVSRDAAYCRCGEKYPRNGQPHMEWFELHRAAAVAAYLRGESK